MARSRIHPGQSVGLPLNAAERKLVCDCMVIEDDYIDRILIIVMKGQI